ncbi:UBX domain-containing protein 4-like [Styela clava]
MVWYSGSIPEAIAESRKSSKLFVVYITGDDEESSRMDEMWNNESVENICKSMCVTLKLSAESEGCKQFSAIYPVLKVPSAHFIDNSGKVLEVIYAQSSLDDFVQNLRNITKFESNAAKSSSEVQEEANSGQTSGAASDENIPKVLPQKSAEEMDAETKRLQQKIIEKREKDQIKKQEDLKVKEVERRELGKNLLKMKEAQQEAKMKQDMEERRRDKQEEKAAKERVKRQIEQDRLDRAARFQQEKLEREQTNINKKAEAEKVNEEKLKEERKERDSKARLQFRMPDGSTTVQQFDSMDVLLSAFSFVVSLNHPLFPTINSFDLATAFPKKVFLVSEQNQTFAELGLSPSASLAVLPRQNRRGISSSDNSVTSSILSMIMFVLLIPSKILMFLRSFISGGTRTEQQQPVTSSQGDASTSHSRWSDDGGLRRRTVGQQESMEPKRQGNMTRLSDVTRDDDDEATWNGNSTQQM